jgi:hypothetical protein
VLKFPSFFCLCCSFCLGVCFLKMSIVGLALKTHRSYHQNGPSDSRLDVVDGESGWPEQVNVPSQPYSSIYVTLKGCWMLVVLLWIMFSSRRPCSAFDGLWVELKMCLDYSVTAISRGSTTESRWCYVCTQLLSGHWSMLPFLWILLDIFHIALSSQCLPHDIELLENQVFEVIIFYSLVFCLFM